MVGERHSYVWIKTRSELKPPKKLLDFHVASLLSMNLYSAAVIASPDLSGHGDQFLSPLRCNRMDCRAALRFAMTKKNIDMQSEPTSTPRHRESRLVGAWRSIPIEYFVHGLCAVSDRIRAARNDK
jgi:hypothetical protein